MNIVFWQNIVSIHQKHFLEALATRPEVSRVTLVVEQTISEDRKRMGWQAPELHGVHLSVAPNEQVIQQLVKDDPSAIHVFSGINVGRINMYAMKLCIQYGCFMGIMAEPYDIEGVKGKLKLIRLQLSSFRLRKNVKFVLAIGYEGHQQYKSSFFKNRSVFEWGYFVTLANKPVFDDTRDNDVRIIFAGRIEHAKGIKRFCEHLVDSGITCSIDIYGEGPDKEAIKKTLDGSAIRHSISPFLPYDELLQKYGQYNWLVLPSQGKDGWGAVISEGLLNGLRVICSRRCGASVTVKNGWNGEVFNWLEEGSCINAINRVAGSKGYASREAISDLASRTLTGDAGAAYFIDIIKYTSGASFEAPLAPWRK